MANGLSRNGKVIGPAWRMGIVRQAEVTDAAPARWDQLLEELGVPSRRAMAEIRERTQAGIRLRRFAAEQYGRYWVPERVLAELGLCADAEISASDCNWTKRREQVKKRLRAEVPA